MSKYECGKCHKVFFAPKSSRAKKCFRCNILVFPSHSTRQRSNNHRNRSRIIQDVRKNPNHGRNLRPKFSSFGRSHGNTSNIQGFSSQSRRNVESRVGNRKDSEPSSERNVYNQIRSDDRPQQVSDFSYLRESETSSSSEEMRLSKEERLLEELNELELLDFPVGDYISGTRTFESYCTPFPSPKTREELHKRIKNFDRDEEERRRLYTDAFEEGVSEEIEENLAQRAKMMYYHAVENILFMSKIETGDSSSRLIRKFREMFHFLRRRELVKSLRKIAECCLKLEEFEEGLVVCDRILELKKEKFVEKKYFQITYLVKANIHYCINEFKKARRCLRKAYRLNSGSKMIKKNVRVFHKGLVVEKTHLKEKEKALSVLMKSTTKNQETDEKVEVEEEEGEKIFENLKKLLLKEKKRLTSRLMKKKEVCKNLQKELDETKLIVAQQKCQMEDSIKFELLEDTENKLEGMFDCHVLENILLENKKKMERVAKLNDQIKKRIHTLKSTDHDSRLECEICFENQKDTILLPCGHTFCKGCSEKLQQCPKCRKGIEKRQKMYL